MKDLVAISVDGTDCYISALLTILKWKLGEYQLAFWDSWLFDFVERESLSDSIDIHMKHILLNLKKFYNCKVKMICGNTQADILKNLVNKLKENEPIIVGIDSYYCNWMSNYKKRHSEHIVIICDRCEEKFLAIDTMPIRNNLVIPYDDLKYGILSAKTVCFEANKKPVLKDFLEYVLVRKMKNKENEKILKFSVSLKGIDLENELDKDLYIWSIPLLKNVRKIYGSRKQFLEVLNYYGKENGQDEYIYKYLKQEFEKVISEWGTIMNILYKAKISSEYSDVVEKIQIKLSKVAEYENNMCSVIRKIIDADFNVIEEPEYVKFLRKKYCQYNGFSHFFEDKDFVRKTKLMVGKVWEKGNLRFLFPKISRFSFNCILCNGQDVKVNDGEISKLHLVGYGIWGVQIEEIEVIYQDRIEKKEIRVSDWCRGANFGEDFWWHGYFEQIKGDSTYNGWIYDIVVEITPDKFLERVRLPKCDKIILFAILVEK